MTDGSGRIDYSYDTQSRLISETRHFDALAAAPTGGNYGLTYEYDLIGQPMSITDPAGAQVGYERDNTGRLSKVTGTGFGNVSTYASDFEYRASGALKQLKYGNTRSLNLDYNKRLQPTHFQVSGVTYYPNQPTLASLDYEYDPDGRMRFAGNLLDHRFDRFVSYDHAGRLLQALSGAEARGGAPTDNRPYRQIFGFDAFDNMTSRGGKNWSFPISFSGTYFNNRMEGFQYDADGRATVTNSLTFLYDSAGQTVQINSPARRHSPSLLMTQAYDGDGANLRRTETDNLGSRTIYFLRSSVLQGQVVTEIGGTPGQQDFGHKQTGHVYAFGLEIAKQNQYLGLLTTSIPILALLPSTLR